MTPLALLFIGLVSYMLHTLFWVIVIGIVLLLCLRYWSIGTAFIVGAVIWIGMAAGAYYLIT